MIDNKAPIIIEKLGYLFNPLILNFTNEKNKLLIFCFHGLYESKIQRDLNHIDPQTNMTVNEFVDFIEYFLHLNYHFIKPDDLLESFHLVKDRPCVMITFDDGYFNNAIAIEILNRYRIPAVFFISTKYVIENKSIWSDIIYKYRTKQGASIETIRKEQQSLKNYKYTYIDRYIEQNFGINSTKPWSDIDRPFSEAELKEFSKNPFVSIGNHTHNHAILTNYDKEEIKEEFTLSNKILIDVTGFVPISIAFPNGNFNNRVLEVAEEVGFRFALTTKSNLNKLPIENSKINSLDRFMTKSIPAKRYITFNRLNYNSNSLYISLKKRITFFK